MGNEQSQLPGIEIEEKAIEVADFWSQHSATICNSGNLTNLSVFISELLVCGPLWTTYTPLEKNSKNLMVYRHPYIIKYISSWHKNSKLYLAVEDVKPLSHVLPTLNPLQICIGLHSILKALCFLHEKALVSHNNICIASIYVARDGTWKLGGMEYLCRFTELTTDYLNKSRSNRYNKSVDPNEEKNAKNSGNRQDHIDVYAFGVLASEALQNIADGDLETLPVFRDLCETSLKNIEVSERPKLSSLLEHEFFSHDFITIHSFLIELPLKSDEEKTDFFLTLVERLKCFNEAVVGRQLGHLLLSRMVLLNKTAQINVLPVILCPRQESDDQAHGIFSEDTFKKYLSPKLIEIFGVRDAQIRLLLLNHFNNFIQTFTKEELQTCILPELLVGIKDTNDYLVSVTLRTLADLVPILGASTVIGGKRAKLFNDGRPTQPTGRRSIRKHETIQNVEPITHLSSVASVPLPERPRPDGEEVDLSTDEVEQSLDEDLDNWEDWADEETVHEVAVSGDSNPSTIEEIIGDSEENEVAEVEVVIGNNLRHQNRALVPDITELDIKNQSNGDGSGNGEDIDFFQDMEPVIETSNKFLIDVADDGFLEKEVSSKLSLNVNNDVHEDGWGDDDWD